MRFFLLCVAACAGSATDGSPTASTGSTSSTGTTAAPLDLPPCDPATVVEVRVADGPWTPFAVMSEGIASFPTDDKEVVLCPGAHRPDYGFSAERVRIFRGFDRINTTLELGPTVAFTGGTFQDLTITCDVDISSGCLQVRSGVEPLVMERVDFGGPGRRGLVVGGGAGLPQLVTLRDSTFTGFSHEAIHSSGDVRLDARDVRFADNGSYAHSTGSLLLSVSGSAGGPQVHLEDVVFARNAYATAGPSAQDVDGAAILIQVNQGFHKDDVVEIVNVDFATGADDNTPYDLVTIESNGDSTYIKRGYQLDGVSTLTCTGEHADCDVAHDEL